MGMDEETLKVLWEYNRQYTWDELVSAISYLNEKGNIDSALWGRLVKLVDDMKQKELSYPQNLELLQQTLNYYLPNY
jgi:hypothetical protein